MSVVKQQRGERQQPVSAEPSMPEPGMEMEGASCGVQQGEGSPTARGNVEAEQDHQPPPPAPAQGAAAAHGEVKIAEYSKMKRKHVDLKSFWDRVGKKPISIESKVQSTSHSIQLQAQNESDIRDEVLSPEPTQPSIEPLPLSPLIDDDEEDDDGDDEAVYDIDFLSHDPGKRIPITQYDVNEQDTVRRGYIALGPCQPREHDFPRRNIGGLTSRRLFIRCS